MKTRLQQIEARLQALVEGNAARLFPGRRQQDDLAKRLVEAMFAGQVEQGSHSIGPNLFTLFVNPEHVQDLQENRALLDGLSETLQRAAEESGLLFLTPPVLRVVAGKDLAQDEVKVVAQNSRLNLTQTSDLGVEQPEELDAIPGNAFLIVDGTRIYPLSQAVINIGRRPDNHLVIDDPRISRVHAQLRIVKGRFVIFDLDSRGGTFVNGERVRQNTLYPGDVISLSGVPLVYGQDSSGVGGTQDMGNPSRGKQKKRGGHV
jgi:hypothetical protein